MLARALAIAVVLCVSVISSAGAASPPLKVRSSLDGEAVLPHRIHWLAYPVAASTKVRVEFLIPSLRSTVSTIALRVSRARLVAVSGSWPAIGRLCRRRRGTPVGPPAASPRGASTG
jgi:hypothetical protein